MRTLRGLFSSVHSRPLLADKLEIAVSDVVRQADELCWVLRKRREAIDIEALTGSTNAKE
jgi:hypothetical protein